MVQETRGIEVRILIAEAIEGIGGKCQLLQLCSLFTHKAVSTITHLVTRTLDEINTYIQTMSQSPLAFQERQKWVIGVLV